ncbi:MAG: fluoride efflux transporter CrcB [Candidatus Binatia bacterium]
MEATLKILSVAVGGALGAVARYLINISPLAGIFAKFPFPTFLINITGSFLIGFMLVLLTDKIQVGENMRMLLIVGFLGAFTTFSTFEAEIWGLVKESDLLLAFGYLFLSVVVGFIGVVAGVRLAERF